MSFLQHKNQKWILLSKRGRLSPFPNTYSMEAVTSITKKLLNGLCFEKILLLFAKRDVSFFADKESLERVEKQGLSFLEKNPSVFEQCIGGINFIAEEWFFWLKDVHKKDLSGFNDKELIELYKTYVKYYKEVYGLYFVVIVLERPLTKYLQEVIKNKTDKTDKNKRGEKTAVNAFTVLTSALEAMYGKQEEKERLEIAFYISKNKELAELFKKNIKHIGNLEKELPKYEELNNAITRHTEDYFWITRDYEDPVLTKRDFLEKIQETLKHGKIEEKRKKALEERKEHEKQIKAVEKHLCLSEKEKRFFKIMRTGVYLKELRKSIVSQSLFYFDNVLNEIARHGDITLPLARFLILDDLEQLLIKKQPYKERLEKRYNKVAFVAENGTSTMYENKEAEELFQNLLKIDKNVREIKGLSGSAGVAIGSARIVKHPSDFHKVQEGDIMVTVQAVPSFLQTLKKCKALVADGGTGITSHPVTLAREVGIPCVVNARIATEIIHDGDIIEVDGNKGIIKIIKKVESYTK